MNYWWVNQKQTWRHEISNGYMWSPKRKSNHDKHFSYEFMKQVQPGDIIFSYANAHIIAIGVAQTHCYSFPKPLDFGKAGDAWSNEGWKIEVKYRNLSFPMRTRDHIESIRPLLPYKYSPIKSASGDANLAYLFKLEKTLAVALATLVDRQTVDLINGNNIADSFITSDTINTHILEWEDRVEGNIKNNQNLTSAEKDTIIKARRGQGKFRELLLAREPNCRVTGVDKPEHLIASHIKPWRSANNEERLDPENGFMFTPSIDHLFDKGFISVKNNGAIILADVANRDSMKKMRVIGKKVPDNIGALSSGQKKYLEWHRESIFLG